MAQAFELLREWAIICIKHRDISRKISGIENTGFGFVISNVDNTAANCFILPSLEKLSEAEIKKAAFIVSLSNDSNIKVIHRMWDLLASNSTLLLIMANPFSSLDEKWLLKPSLHNRICDRNSLLQGLKAMAELVEPIDEGVFAKKATLA